MPKRDPDLTDIPFEALDDALYMLGGDVAREVEFALDSEANATLPADIHERLEALKTAARRVVSFGSFYGLYTPKEREPIEIAACEGEEEF